MLAAKPIQCGTAHGTQRLAVQPCLRAWFANRHQRWRTCWLLAMQPGQGTALVAIVRVDTPLPLPERKFQRAQPRQRLRICPPVQRIVVQLHQIIEQQVHRPAIDDNVVQVHQQATTAIGKRQ